MAKVNQGDVVLKYLREHKSMTPQDAIPYKILRLADVVYNLKKKGHNIVTTIEESKNEYGHIRYASYSLVVEPKQKTLFQQ